MRYCEIINEGFEGYKIVTSNQNKLREFNRFGLPITAEAGKDLAEVNGSPIDVIIHKARDAGPMHIVEDTSFDVQGMDVGVNVRWLVDQLLTDESLSGRPASWTVLLGVNTGQEIQIFKGQIFGSVGTPEGEGFGFDPIFYPKGSDHSMAVLDSSGKKDHFSARKMAVDNMLAGQPLKTIPLSDISDWQGDYQH